MQEHNFIHITTGIAQVIEAEEKLLRFARRGYQTKAEYAESHHQADSRSLD